MLLAWSYKDLVSAIFTNQAGYFWAYLITALVITTIVAVLQSLPCSQAASKALEDGENTIVNRIKIVAGSMALALGFAWNQVGGGERTVCE